MRALVLVHTSSTRMAWHRLYTVCVFWLLLALCSAAAPAHWRVRGKLQTYGILLRPDREHATENSTHIQQAVARANLWVF
jgi:hypothetical protein